MHPIVGRLWRGWKRLARRIGEFQTRAFLILFYFLLLVPLTVVVRAGDPLGVRRHAGWRRYQDRSDTLRVARRQ